MMKNERHIISLAISYDPELLRLRMYNITSESLRRKVDDRVWVGVMQTVMPSAQSVDFALASNMNERPAS